MDFSFSISLSNEYPGLTPFRMDWSDLLTVQGTLKSLLQHHSSEASILWCSAFFIVQLSHPYVTTREIIALTRRTFVDKVTSPPFNTHLSYLRVFWYPTKGVKQEDMESGVGAPEGTGGLCGLQAGPCTAPRIPRSHSGTGPAPRAYVGMTL